MERWLARAEARLRAESVDDEVVDYVTSVMRDAWCEAEEDGDALDVDALVEAIHGLVEEQFARDADVRAVCALDDV